MEWLKRHGAGLVLTAALALVGGMAIGCGDSKDNNGGSGGSGGADAGGTGGGDTGGTGGGPELCGNKECGDGELCNRAKNPPKCECVVTSDFDSCEEFGMVCGPNKTCIEETPVGPWLPCDVPGEFNADGTFFCLPGFGTNGQTSLWMAVCGQTSECEDTLTFCDHSFSGGGEIGLCYYNWCGEDALDDKGNLTNGQNWGTCDSENRQPTDPTGESAKGQCVPLDGETDAVFLCLGAGDVELGGDCRWDVDTRTPEACAAHTICLTKQPGATACETSVDCADTQECKDSKCAARSCTSDDQCGTGYCDADEKICRPFGQCSETCNAGYGEDASCTATGDVCFGAMTNHTNEWKDARGYCTEAGCDLLGGPGECEDVDGKTGMCIFAGAFKGNPLMGVCATVTGDIVPKDDPCAGESTCEQGTICVGRDPDFFCRSLCACPDADWDPQTGNCKVEVEACGADQVCGFVNGAPWAVGICAAAEE